MSNQTQFDHNNNDDNVVDLDQLLNFNTIPTTYNNKISPNTIYQQQHQQQHQHQQHQQDEQQQDQQYNSTQWPLSITTDGRTHFTILVDQTDTIEAIKMKIYEYNTNIPIEQQQLYQSYESTIIYDNDTKTLYELNITQDFILYVNYGQTITIYLQTIRGDQHEITLQPTQLIQELITIGTTIWDRNQLPGPDFFITVQHKVIASQFEIRYGHIVDNSKVLIVSYDKTKITF